jgi:hypothetical protein
VLGLQPGTSAAFAHRFGRPALVKGYNSDVKTLVLNLTKVSGGGGCVCIPDEIHQDDDTSGLRVQ